MMAIEGWDYKNIDDLAVLDQESLGEGTKRDFSFYYIDISSVSEGKLRLPSTKIIFRDAPSRARKIVRRSDVLMSMVRPNLKAFAYFDHTDDDCIASTGFAVLTARDQVDARFILYSILSDGVTAQIEALVVGSNYPAINSNAVRGLQVLVPPYSEQTKIAEILSTVDQAIEQTEALIAKQQRIKTGLMQDLLTRGIDEHGNLRSERTHEFKDSPLGRIPVEWKMKTLGQVSNLVTNGFVGVATPHYTESSDGIPYLYGNNIRSNHIDIKNVTFINHKFHQRQHKSQLLPGDMLTVQSGHIGTTAIVPESLGASNCHALIITKFKKDILNPHFVSFYCNFCLETGIMSHLFIGSTIKHINTSDFAKFAIPFPSKKEQSNIVDRLFGVGRNSYTTKGYLAKLLSLKTALMQDLLTGKKRVTALLEASL